MSSAGRGRMHPAAEGYGYSTTGGVVDVSSRQRREVEEEALFLLANMILHGMLRVELKIYAPKGGGVGSQAIDKIERKRER